MDSPFDLSHARPVEVIYPELEQNGFSTHLIHCNSVLFRSDVSVTFANTDMFRT